jgi:nucleotide-binding universal stress UspA family protein
MTGDPVDIIARGGGAFDLIVASHPLLGSEAMPSQVLDAAIFNTARPVLLASKEVPSCFGETILLAWNRGIQAGRAFISAFPFLQTASKIVVVMVTTGSKQGPEPEDIVTNLAWHDVDAEVKRIPPDYRSVGEVLLDEAAEIGADLLVMGAYSQSRLRDRVPGGVTKAILTRAEVPVLMAR